jgi:tetratricopeptide (TPR) repeat protein
MRLLPRVLIVGFASIALAAPVAGQRTDDQINPKSLELQRQGKALLSAGKLEQAQDALETAGKQHLYGKAIRMTNRALLIEPNDPDAIAVQGEAMVELGAVPRAQANLQKLQGICRQGCPQIAQLSAAIGRGPTVAAAKPPATPKSN